MTPSCFPRWAGSKHVILTWKVSFKIWPQVRSRSGHDPNKSICKSSEADWQVKSFGTICASLSPSCRELLAKTGFWPHLTSGDLPVTPNHQLHLDHHRWSEWPWSWKNWVVLVGLCETGSIFICPHRPHRLENGEVTKLTWPYVTRIKILRRTFYRFWWD